MKRVFILLLFCFISAGCENTYYAAMEKVGQHKRDILISRVENANEAQQEAQQEFQDALTHLASLIQFDGEDLNEQYQLSKSHFEASQSAADDVTKRINAVDKVAQALFDEWQEEIDLFQNPSLKYQSQQKLSQTQTKYKALIRSMRKAENRMAPILTALQDNTLFLKHNLNAKAIGAIQGEFTNIKRDIERLIADMNTAIKQSNQFIEQMKQ